MLLRKIQVKAYGKINLSLNIAGMRDGMHELDTAVTSVDIADVITVSAREDTKVFIQYMRGRGLGEAAALRSPKNCSVTKAVNALKGRFGNFGADISVEKNIPVAAGLGGSSADAAGVIRAFEALCGLDLSSIHPPPIIHQIGSDVPYMLKGGFCRVQGIGERLTIFTAPLLFWVVIAKRKGGVQSSDAYRKFDEMYKSGKLCPSDNAALIAALKKRDKAAAYKLMDNALYAPSVSLNPEIAVALAALGEAGADKAVMTGSGSACVGFFAGEHAAKAAAEQLGRQGFYAKAVKTLRKGIEIV